MDYEVQDHDTLERIAASHDCTVGELIKLNKMGTRFVFSGQHILVPVPISDDVFEQQHAVTSNKSTNIHNTSRLSSGAESSGSN
jgi:LysM repeat protein